MGTLSDLWNSLEFSAMLSALMRLIAVFLCLTVHKTCHGLAAYALGDPTAKREHRLSLNPLHHIDWVGLACMLVLGFGWAKPVPVDMRYFKKPKQGMALTALAGPVSNVLLALVFLFLYGLLYRALYSVQLEQFGYVMLYPALAMAGAGQVGAAIAIARKAKKVGNERMRNVIRGALPAGFLGVGEPLIYGVTLPMGKPFITAGLGAGFGGAFAMATEVAATTWGPSGLLALFVMTAGPHGAVNSVLCYGVGLVISYVMGYVITNLMVKDEEVANA